jgi:DNA processing protein
MTEERYAGYARNELSISDSAYPESLRQIVSAPPRLYLIGEASILKLPALAIVGARKASPYGLACARRFGKRAAYHGLVVVSGGAIGCDQAAHLGALDYESPTIVVLGCGADVVYPSKAAALFERVLAAGGLLLSEAPWHSPPNRWAFRKRNRIIAGLGSATLIIEAGLPSGTFSTADATLAQGKELMAVPGSIFSQQSKGSNHLIAQGALPIIDDLGFDSALASIYSALPLRLNADSTANFEQANMLLFGSGSDFDDLDDLDDDADELPASPTLVEYLRLTPSYPDDLVGRYGLNIIEVIRCLSALEFGGEIQRLRDGRYVAICVEDDAKAG